MILDSFQTGAFLRCRWRTGFNTSTRTGLRPFFVLPVLFFISAFFTEASDIGTYDSSSPTRHRPKTCLVLSGGGALGVVHVGVLKYLEEQRIPIDCITGTSMGAIIGGLYASGYTATELETLVKSTNWIEVFEDSAPRSEKSFQRKLDDLNLLIKYQLRLDDKGKLLLPQGIIQGNKIDLSFLEFTLRSRSISNFDKLPIPFRAIAVDIESGEQVILSQGSLANAMRASMSIPGVFSPIEVDEHLLVDGGVLNNLPIDIARNMGAERIIAVDIEKKLKNKEELRSAIDIAQQVVKILIQKNKNQQIATLAPSDVLIIPDVGNYTTSSFDKTTELIEPGYIAAQLLNEQLKQLAIDEKAYFAHRLNQVAPEQNGIIISFIEVDNQSGVNDRLIKETLEIQTGQILSVDALKKDLVKLTGLGYFDNVVFDIAEKRQNTGLVVRVYGPNTTSRSNAEIDVASSPNFLQFGLLLEDDFNGDSQYNFGLRYKRLPINTYGGELIADLQIGERAKAIATWFQPIDQQARFFVQPTIGYDARNIPFFEEGKQFANVRLHSADIGISIGKHFGNVAELRAGIKRGVAYADTISGVPDLDLGNFQTASYYFRGSYDTLESFNFPKKGLSLDATLTGSFRQLGEDEEYQTFEFNFIGVNSWGRDTLLLSSTMNVNFLEKNALQGIFTFGGFGSVSGYEQDELTATNYMIHQLGYYHEWSKDSKGPFSIPIFTGMTLEAVGIFDTKDDISFSPDDYFYAGSVFVGAETLLGPVFLGYGRSEDDSQSVYLFLGRNF